MLRFIAKRLLWMVPALFAVSFLAFVLIQLPPGDFVTSYVATLAASNEIVDQNAAAALRERFGLNDPMLWQYAKWIGGNEAGSEVQTRGHRISVPARAVLAFHIADPIRLRGYDR